jgi:DNA-binding transcriptional LysR family regulator
MTERWSLDDLRVFCAVADAGSLTAAGDAVGLSLSSVSARLKALEEAFGIELCRRSHKGVQLTPAGVRLQAHARDLLEKAALVTEDVTEFGTQPRGLVRLAANTTAVTEHLPDLLAAFLAAHPRIDVALVEGVSADVLKQVREGQADIGICTPGPAAGDLRTLPFRSDRMVLVVPANHAWAGRGHIAFEECLWSDHVCLQRSAAMYGFLVQRARDQGRQLKGRIHVAGFDAMARLVGRGVGVGVMPESSARRLEQAHGLGVLVLDDAWADIPLFVCMRSLEELSPSSRALLAALQPEDLPPG